MQNNKDTKKITNISSETPIDPNFERMLKSFLRQVQKDGILQEVKKRRYYIKPSELKRMKNKQLKKS